MKTIQDFSIKGYIVKEIPEVVECECKGCYFYENNVVSNNCQLKLDGEFDWENYLECGVNSTIYTLEKIKITEKYNKIKLRIK